MLYHTILEAYRYLATIDQLTFSIYIIKIIMVGHNFKKTQKYLHNLNIQFYNLCEKLCQNLRILKKRNWPRELIRFRIQKFFFSDSDYDYKG
jgi:hypothetical protein